MDTLPTIITIPWIKRNDDNCSTSSTPRTPQSFLNHHLAKPIDDQNHVDPQVFKSKNDFSYDMYMLNRKFRRVKKDVVDHCGHYQKIAQDLQERKP